MLKNNAYRKNDKYLYFLFDGIHSSKYNLFITNNNNLQLVNNGKSTTSYVSPSYQDYTHYVGTTTGQKEFKYNVAAEGISLPEYKDMMKWLYNGRQGFLMLDYNNPWGYEVVLETVGDSTFQDTNRGLVVEFSLSFKTIGYHHARQEFGSQYSTHELIDVQTVEDNGTTITDKNSVEQTIQNPWGIPEVIPFVYYNLQISTGDCLKFDCRTAKNASFEIMGIGLEWIVNDGQGSYQQADVDAIIFSGPQCVLQLDTENVLNKNIVVRAAAEIKISFKANGSDSYELLTWENQTVNFYLPSINNCFSHFKYTTSGKHKNFSVKVKTNNDADFDTKCNYNFNIAELWTLTYDQQWRYCVYNNTTLVEGMDKSGCINLYASQDRLVSSSQELEDFVLQNNTPILITPQNIQETETDDVVISFDQDTIEFLFDLDEVSGLAWDGQQYLSISYKDNSDFSNFCSPYSMDKDNGTCYDYKFFNVYYIADENVMPLTFNGTVYQLTIPKSQFLLQLENTQDDVDIEWQKPIIYLGNYNTIEIKNDQYNDNNDDQQTSNNNIIVQVNHYNNL